MHAHDRRACSHTLVVQKTTHTYLDGTSPFKYLGLWAVEILHSTATLSILSEFRNLVTLAVGGWDVTVTSFPIRNSTGGVCGLYGLRLMHHLNIFQSRSGHSGWAGAFLCF
ncbi:hypothetical protein Hypma_004149, partial [Hypsizygus marmoreus]